jgi:hypothetical protein
MTLGKMGNMALLPCEPRKVWPSHPTKSQIMGNCCHEWHGQRINGSIEVSACFLRRTLETLRKSPGGVRKRCQKGLQVNETIENVEKLRHDCLFYRLFDVFWVKSRNPCFRSVCIDPSTALHCTRKGIFESD